MDSFFSCYIFTLPFTFIVIEFWEIFSPLACHCTMVTSLECIKNAAVEIGAQAVPER